MWTKIKALFFKKKKAEHRYTVGKYIKKIDLKRDNIGYILRESGLLMIEALTPRHINAATPNPYNIHNICYDFCKDIKSRLN